MAGSSPNCLLARAKLAQHVASLRKSSLTEQAVGLIKTGFLSPKTILKKTAGDVVLAGVENLATRPLAVAYDYLTALARSAASFGKESPGQLRDLGNTLSIPGLKFGAKGFADGLQKSIQILKTGVDADHVMERMDLQKTTYKNPIVQALYDGVYNALHATVKPWYGFAFNTSLYGRAVALAGKEGLSGTVASARINELLASPTDEMAMGAANDAEYATLTNKTALGDMASNAKSNLKRASENPKNNAAKRLTAKAGYVGSELTVPYTGVPSAIGGVLVDYSPIGIAKIVGTLIQQLGKDAPKEPGLQGKLATGAARATIGTAGLWGLGYLLAQKGMLTGSMPTDPKERAQWEVEGKQPYSVKIGNTWHSVTGIAPLGLALPIMADVVHANDRMEQKGKVATAATDLGVAAGSMGKVLTQQSFLQGVSAITDALNSPENKGGTLLSNLAGSPIPSTVSQVAHGMDATVRKSSSFTDRLQAKIPGAESALPARLNTFGDTVSRGSGGALGVAREMFDITSSRADLSTPVTKEMDRLGVMANPISKTGKLGAQSYTRTTEEQNALASEFGPIKKAVLDQVIASPAYQSADDVHKREALLNVLKSLQSEATHIDEARRRGANIPHQTVQGVIGRMQSTETPE